MHPGIAAVAVAVLVGIVASRFRDERGRTRRTISRSGIANRESTMLNIS